MELSVTAGLPDKLRKRKTGNHLPPPMTIENLSLAVTIENLSLAVTIEEVPLAMTIENLHLHYDKKRKKIMFFEETCILIILQGHVSMGDSCVGESILTQKTNILTSSIQK